VYSTNNGYYQNPLPRAYSMPYSNLGQQTLNVISPAISHGLREAQHLGFQHALTEAVAIGYLMGRGYDYNTAWKTVESWWRPPGTQLPISY
jgi:ABC-type phosphate transport system permease subunit